MATTIQTQEKPSKTSKSNKRKNSTEVNKTVQTPAEKHESKPVSANSSTPTKKKANPLDKKSNGISDDARNAFIAEAAYFIAEHRGFTGGDPAMDWILAEKQVEQMLTVGKQQHLNKSR